MAYMKTVYLWTKGVMGTGSTNLSDPIELPEHDMTGNFSLSYRVGASGGVGTAATTNFTYQLAPTRDSTFAAPITGDLGTLGTAGSGAAGSIGVIGFSPVLAPFMRIRAIVGTSGTNEVTAALHVW